MKSKRKYFKVEFSLQENPAITKMSEWGFHLLINLPYKIAIQLSKRRWICSRVSMMWWVRESPVILTPFLSVKAVKKKFMRNNHLLSDLMWTKKCKSFKLPHLYKLSSQIEYKGPANLQGLSRKLVRLRFWVKMRLRKHKTQKNQVRYHQVRAVKLIEKKKVNNFRLVMLWRDQSSF